MWSCIRIAYGALGCSAAAYCRTSAGKAEDNPPAMGAPGRQSQDAAAVAEAALTLAAAIGPQIGKTWHLCNIVVDAGSFPGVLQMCQKAKPSVWLQVRSQSAIDESRVPLEHSSGFHMAAFSNLTNVARYSDAHGTYAWCHSRCTVFLQPLPSFCCFP